jgi:hypothetical protein
VTACPDRGQGLKVPDNLIGQKVRCGVLFVARPFATVCFPHPPDGKAPPCQPDPRGGRTKRLTA